MDALTALEHASFAPGRQEGKASIKRSILSPHQEVWVLRAAKGDSDGTPDARHAPKSIAKSSATAGVCAVHKTSAALKGTAWGKSSGAHENTATPPTNRHIRAAMVLRLTAHAMRIYSLAVCQSCRGQGLGQQLLDHALARAASLGKTTALLEADAADPRLLNWYGNCGFTPVKRLPDYYGQGQDGIRLRLRLQTDAPPPARPGGNRPCGTSPKAPRSTASLSPTRGNRRRRAP